MGELGEHVGTQLRGAEQVAVLTGLEQRRVVEGEGRGREERHDDREEDDRDHHHETDRELRGTPEQLSETAPDADLVDLPRQDRRRRLFDDLGGRDPATARLCCELLLADVVSHCCAPSGR